MITTVTQPFREAVLNSTLTTVAANELTIALVTSVGLIITIALIFLLINKELLGTTTNPNAVRLRRSLDVALMPLAFSFIMLAAVTISSVFQ